MKAKLLTFDTYYKILGVPDVKYKVHKGIELWKEDLNGVDPRCCYFSIKPGRVFVYIKPLGMILIPEQYDDVEIEDIILSTLDWSDWNIELLKETTDFKFTKNTFKRDSNSHIEKKYKDGEYKICNFETGETIEFSYWVDDDKFFPESCIAYPEKADVLVPNHTLSRIIKDNIISIILKVNGRNFERTDIKSE